MVNMPSLRGIFTLSVIFQTRLNLEGLFVGTTHTLLNVFCLSLGTKRLTVAVISWLELTICGHLLNFPYIELACCPLRKQDRAVPQLLIQVYTAILWINDLKEN